MVYILSHTGKALMPTNHHGKVRHLLREGKARVVRREPFTIQLLYESKEYTQPVTLGVDAGTGHIGLSATWLAPSVEQAVQSHLALIRKIHSFLPITETITEVAQFDTQLLKNPEIVGTEYQQGEQLGFWNTREYVLFRDNHTCQYCHGKSKDKILNVHHIESRKTGGNAPENLITLCKTCHKAFHRGEIKLKVKRGASLRDAALMNVMRWTVYNRAKKEFGNVRMTYGYITKNTRIENGLNKSHAVDARCISGHPLAEPAPSICRMLQVRRHTRSLHVMKHSKGGIRRSAVASHWIGKSRLQRYDTIMWNGLKGFIAGSTNGRPILRDINWKLLTPAVSVNPKTITFLHKKTDAFLCIN